MPRYIDADKVMEEINRIGGHNLCEWETIGVKALIDRQPTADVAPKSVGEWETIPDYSNALITYRHICGVCGCFYKDIRPHGHKYCHECGAKMKDGE